MPQKTHILFGILGTGKDARAKNGQML